MQKERMGRVAVRAARSEDDNYDRRVYSCVREILRGANRAMGTEPECDDITEGRAEAFSILKRAFESATTPGRAASTIL